MTGNFTGIIDQLEQRKAAIERALMALREVDGVATSEPQASVGGRKKFSASSRRKMALAQKARWAKVRGESEPSAAAPETAKPKRRISEEGMKRIIAATKKRWRLKRAAAAAQSAPAAKKVTRAKKAVSKKAAPAAAAVPPQAAEEVV